jgi:hypothetical protein
MRDRTGKEVPEKLEPIFKEGASIRRWLGLMRSTAQGFRQIRLKRDTDIGVTSDEVMTAIYVILDRLELALPHAVCQDCKQSPTCTCKGRGWIPARKLNCRSTFRRSLIKARDSLLTESAQESSESSTAAVSTL